MTLKNVFDSVAANWTRFQKLRSLYLTKSGSLIRFTSTSNLEIEEKHDNMLYFPFYNNMKSRNALYTGILKPGPFAFVVLIFSYILWKYILIKRSVRSIKSLMGTKSVGKNAKISKLNHFRFSYYIPYLDGLITMYRLRQGK